MDLERATEIIRALADGVDPSTGEIATRDTALQEPDTIRALHFALGLLERVDRKQRAVSAKSGSGWSREEDAQLCKEFHQSLDFADIAKIHGRSRTEIYGRLVALGVVRTKVSGRRIA